MKLLLNIVMFVFAIDNCAYCNVPEKDTLISIMKECVLLNKNFLISTKNDPQNIAQQNKLRHKFEEYFEQMFLPKANNIIYEICTFKNKELIQEYFSLRSNLKNCADETLSTILFKVYLCQPDFFVEELLNLSACDYNEIIKKSQESFIKNTYGKENQVKNFSLLKSKLFELQIH